MTAPTSGPLRRRRLALLCASGLALIGCANRNQALYSQFPLERARAVVASAQRGDQQAVPKLVDLLGDLDAAVRMYSIVALQRLTNQTYGYQYYAAPPERERAIERWRAALRAGEVIVQIAPN